MQTELSQLKPSRKYVVALLLFVVYAVALFVHNLSVQQRLEQSLLDGASLELAKQADSVSAYLSERHNSLANLAASDAVANYFAGRDLGMSVEYGLGLHLQAIEDHLEQLLERTPGFEQVVVGKTGKMAVMRTVDPRLFVSLERALHAVAASVKADEESELPVRLVEQMIDTSMVVTKLDEASTAALSEEVQNIVRDAVANGDSAGGITAVPESQP